MGNEEERIVPVGYKKENNDKEKRIVLGVKIGMGASLGVGALCMILGFLGVFALLFPGTMLLLLFSFFFFLGLKSIPNEERWVVEVYGKYYATKGPGLSWICPKVMKVRSEIPVYEQRYPLFVDGKIEVDFKNGTAIPTAAFAYVVCTDPKKATYEIKNVKEATVSLIQPVIRSYLGTLTVADATEMSAGRYDILKHLPDGRDTDIIEAVQDWGIEIKKVVIGDYDLDRSIIEARLAVQKAERALDAEVFNQQKKALEIGGAHKGIKALLMGDGYSEEKADQLASDYMKYWKGSEEGVITDWRFTGGSDPYAEIAKISAIHEKAKKNREKDE